MTVYHMHHIIPKHMGGSNEPSNLIKLTVEEHAEAHRKLWEEHGKLEDHIAYRMLSGQISAADATKLIQKKPKSADHKRKISESNIKVKNTPDFKHKARTSAIAQHAKGPSGFSGKTHTEKVRNIISKTHKGKITPESTKEILRIKCPRPKELNGMWGVIRPKIECPHLSLIHI